MVTRTAHVRSVVTVPVRRTEEADEQPRARRWLPGRLPASVPGSVPQRALFAEGLLGSGADAVMPFLPVYLVALSASAAQVGLLSSAAGLAGLIALGPGAWLARRAGSRRVALLLGGGALARVTMLLMAVVPFVFSGHSAVYALIALGGVRSLLTVAAQPAWVSVFADVVPDGLRQRYSSLRSLGTGFVAMACAPAVGWLIHAHGGIQGFQWAFLLAAGVGLISTATLTRVHVPDIAPPKEKVERAGLLGNASFRRFVLASVSLQVFSMMAGPLFIVHLVQNLGATTAEVGALASLDPVAAVVGQLVASALVVRCAPRRLIIATLMVSPLMPVIWLGITDPWQAAVPNLISGATWGVFHLASFNLLLQLAPRDDLPRYSATLQSTGMVAAFAGPLAGSALVALGGIPLVFVISAAGRAAALALFVAPTRPWPRRAPEVAEPAEGAGIL